MYGTDMKTTQEIIKDYFLNKNGYVFDDLPVFYQKTALFTLSDVETIVQEVLSELSKNSISQIANNEIP